jgi:hypothetical protein
MFRNFWINRYKKVSELRTKLQNDAGGDTKETKCLEKKQLRILKLLD